MEMIWINFHFLRPLWLVAIVPGLLFIAAAWFVRVRSSSWAGAVDPTLLPYLLDTGRSRRQAWPLIVLLAAWLLTVFSLAGPTWKKLPEPVRKKEDALVILQDLSLSMYARDLSPDRLTRVRHKLEDLLEQRREGLTALVVYAGDAHVVTPLTDDSRTVMAQVPSLAPAIMPTYGSNVGAAVKLGLRLLEDVGLEQGRLLLVTDEVEAAEVERITDLLQGRPVVLSVLGVGTRDGGPIPLRDGGFLKDESGSIVVPKLNSSVLAELARRNHGRYRQISLDDSDLQALLEDEPTIPVARTYREVERRFDRWQEMGPWLLLLVVPFALLAFRRGWLLVLVGLILLSGTGEAGAVGWSDLWLRRDQQAARALERNEAEKAAELFTSPRWRAIARYRAGDYEGALEDLGRGESADDLYNRGNFLARAGKLEEALAAYEQALAEEPDMEDARVNLELVRKLLERRKQQEARQDSDGRKSDRQEKQEGKKSEDSDGQEQNDRQKAGQGRKNKGDGKTGLAEDNREAENRQESGGPARDQAGREQDAVLPESARDGQQSRSGEEQLAADEKMERERPGPEKQQENELPQDDRPRVVLPEDSLSDEQRQALEQWLRQVPDNPGGLLRRKFEYEYQQNQDRLETQQSSKIW